MDIANLTFGFDALRWFVLGGIGIYAWIVGRQSASSKELTDLRARIVKLEADMQQVPSQKQLHELALQIGRAVASTEALAQRVDAVGRSTNRIEDFLLNSK